MGALISTTIKLLDTVKKVMLDENPVKTVDYIGMAKKLENDHHRRRERVSLPERCTYGEFYLYKLHNLTFDRFPAVSDVIKKLSLQYSNKIS